ncbi:hypothetical protein LIER_06270 [Lithospermum erythrorhizon]|uniref:Uncharacterized protein n=1 Tax=Lithospermum erythrorhizon TaxID=34254 RepID=A0AAV3P5G0_LITER
MKALIEFGRKAMFYVRVLSGYEERRIRSLRIAMQRKIQQAEAKKAALNKVPEQIILSEVRRMVDEMQSLNKKLDDTEVAIEKYFNSVDKDAEMIMEVQLKEEEKNMKEMMKIMQKQALLEKTEAEVISDKHNADGVKNKASS